MVTIDEKLLSALERIAIALESSSKPDDLGLCQSPEARRIYIRGEGDYLWYFLDENNHHIPIVDRDAIRGVIFDISIVSKEYREKEKPKLDISVNAGEQSYILRSGLETVFSKGLLLGLDAIGEKIRQPVTIAVQRGTDVETVVFCRLFDANKERVKTDWNPNADWAEIISRLQERLEGRQTQKQELPVKPEAKPPATKSQRERLRTANLKPEAPLKVVPNRNSLNQGEFDPQVEEKALRKEILKLLNILQWTPERGRTWIENQFNKSRSADLNFEELEYFHDSLNAIAYGIAKPMGQQTEDVNF